MATGLPSAGVSALIGWRPPGRSMIASRRWPSAAGPHPGAAVVRPAAGHRLGHRVHGLLLGRRSRSNETQPVIPHMPCPPDPAQEPPDTASGHIDARLPDSLG